MAISVSVSSQVTSQKKAIWAWVVSEKTTKYGSTKTELSVVGELVGVYSALTTLPNDKDIIIRTQQKSIASVINDGEKSTRNPVVLKIYELIRERFGSVRAVVVNTATITDNDKRCYKMALVLSHKYQQKSVQMPQPATARSILRPAKAPVQRKRKQSREFLVTGLEDDDEIKYVTQKEEAKVDTIFCSSCGQPVDPFVPECRCSR
jgi:ribosomal protein L23